MKFVLALPAAALTAALSFVATAAEPAKPAGAEAGRDWSKIDTNRDGLISPEEMEAWLKANPGPLKKG